MTLSLCVYELLNCNVKSVCCIAVLMPEARLEKLAFYIGAFFTVFYWLCDVKELVIAASKHDSDTEDSVCRVQCTQHSMYAQYSVCHWFVCTES